MSYKNLDNIYKDKYNLSESNHGLFQVNISNNTLDKIYLIEFKYTTIGELAYKELKDEKDKS